MTSLFPFLFKRFCYQTDLRNVKSASQEKYYNTSDKVVFNIESSANVGASLSDELAIPDGHFY